LIFRPKGGCVKSKFPSRGAAARKQPLVSTVGSHIETPQAPAGATEKSLAHFLRMAVASSLRLDIGAQRRNYNKQIGPITNSFVLSGPGWVVSIHPHLKLRAINIRRFLVSPFQPRNHRQIAVATPRFSANITLPFAKVGKRENGLICIEWMRLVAPTCLVEV